MDTIAAPQKVGTMAWRISQNMKGCPPAMIDSVIQANLPQRIRVRSERPDTLSLPGLPGEYPWLAYTYQRRAVYEEGYFADNQLLHPELPFRQHGRSADPIPYQLWRDDWVTGTLLIAYLLLVFIIRRARREFVLQLRNFFYNPTNVESPFARGITFRPTAVLYMVVLLSLLGGFITYIHAQSTLNLFLSQISPYLLMLVYVACFLLYFAVRRLATNAVDWVFFTRAQHLLWVQSCHLITSVQCLLAFPVAAVMVYFHLSLGHALTALTVVWVASVVGLAYKCWTIFFGKPYCLLHFFSYLCALEVLPALALLRVMACITDNMIAK